MKRTQMTNVKDILRHRYSLDLSRDEIAAAVGVSAGTVSNVLRRAAAARLSSWPLPDDLDDEALRARLYPQKDRDGETVQPEWDAIIEEFNAPRGRRRAKLTQRQLWIEYRDEAQAKGGAAYSYSRFCTLFNAQRGGRHTPTQMHFNYAPGLYGMSDFSGKTLPLRTGTGEVDVEIFVALLPHSNLTYVEAVPDQTICHWTMVHRRTLEYFGGCTKCWIIDNLKSGVTKADREEPHLNPSFREFANHYGLAILPARSMKPTDKGPVEAAVGAVQSRILLPLRHETFFSIGEMNAAIRRELDKFNTEPMAKGQSRREIFEASERPVLVPLPEHPWEWGKWQSRKVAPNGHVAFDRNHYSVPDGHIGRSVDVRAGEHMIEVFLERGGERIAVHRLKSGRNQYSTVPDHMPDRLSAVRDIRSPDYGDILLERSRRIGANALSWAQRCMASKDYPQQAYTAVQGMTRLAENHGNARVDAACAEALSRDRLASGYLREAMKTGGKAVVRPEPEEIIPSHSNLRGPTYYSKNQEGKKS